MTTFERFEVPTALFPFLDIPVRKPRPVLVFSARTFNAEHGHVIGAMITTAAAGSWPSDHVIQNLEAAGLKHRSVVRWKIFTLPGSVIGRRIGALDEADRLAVDAAWIRTFSQPAA